MTPGLDMDLRIYDSGIIRTTIPKGWNAFAATDSEGKLTPKKFFIYKNAIEPTDIFCKAGITVCYFSEDEIYFSPKNFYDDVCDIEPFEAGFHTWHGYTCKSLGYPYIMLEAYENGKVFQVMILTKNGEESIALHDDDVQAIIGNIQLHSLNNKE